MAVFGTIIPIATSATIVASGAWGVVSSDATVHNVDSGTAFLGGASVGTLTAGFALAPDAAVSLPLLFADVLYGIAMTGTVQVHVLFRGAPPT